MRPWRCDCLIKSLRDLSDPSLRVVNVRLHRVHSQLLIAAQVQRHRANVHFNPLSCRCQRVSLRCTSCELEASLSNSLVAFGSLTRLDWHLVVSLWSAPECAPFHSCKHALHIVVGHQRVMNVLKHVSAIHVLFVVVSSRSCQSSLAKALLPASCHVFSRSGARRTRTVQFLVKLL